MIARPAGRLRPLASARTATLITTLFISLVTLVAFAGALATAAPASAAAKGIIDWRLEKPDGTPSTEIPTLVAAMGAGQLGAKWTRVYVRWARLEPTAPVNGVDTYDPAYVQELTDVVAAFHAAGIKVILTGTDTPEWASDSSYWVDHTYDSDIVPRIDDPAVSAAWQNLWRTIATWYAGSADYFEVWNEPNLGSGLYPQLVGTQKTVVGPAVYLKMLKGLRTAAKQGNPSCVVIAGGTSRRGANDEHSTSPQWFATYLKKQGAAKYFDAYSHHPYTPPGSNPAPTALPQRPRSMVTLGNLSVLLKLFPTKPFYLTEYGYSTGAHDYFAVTVSPADQARYLRQAYAFMARYKQVKALFWFLVTDYEPNATDGIYSGLETRDGIRKPGWFAFAGGNKVTITAPVTCARGKSFAVSGTLTTRLGAGAGVDLILQARAPKGKTWTTVATKTASETGGYAFTVKPTATKVYRVAWNGVVESAGKQVKLK